MSQREPGVAQGHARAGIAHHRPHLLALDGAVAVNLAAVADRFLFLEWAAGEPLMGIGAQLLALGAAVSAGSMIGATVELMVILAINIEHRIDGALFMPDSGADARTDDASAGAAVDF